MKEYSKLSGLVEKVSFLCTVETKMMTIEQKRCKSPQRKGIMRRELERTRAKIKKLMSARVVNIDPKENILHKKCGRASFRRIKATSCRDGI